MRVIGEACAAISGCAFAFCCPREWTGLARTQDPDVRHCQVCAQSVYFCRDELEARPHIVAGHCIAIQERDAHGNKTMMVGVPMSSDDGGYLELSRFSRRRLEESGGDGECE